jgi:hypothetical protein
VWNFCEEISWLLAVTLKDNIRKIFWIVSMGEKRSIGGHTIDVLKCCMGAVVLTCSSVLWVTIVLT